MNLPGRLFNGAYSANTSFAFSTFLASYGGSYGATTKQHPMTDLEGGSNYTLKITEQTNR